jgi:predicted transposase YdaD
MLQSIKEVGIEEGIDIGRRGTARNLLLLNALTEEQIAQATNLSIEEVRRLKQEMEGASPE